jgi:hypothetical protein
MVTGVTNTPTRRRVGRSRPAQHVVGAQLVGALVASTRASPSTRCPRIRHDALASESSCADRAGHASPSPEDKPGGRSGREAILGVVLAMTTVIYACCGAVRTTQSSGTEWVVFALVAGVVVLWGSVGWHALREGRTRSAYDQRLFSVGSEAWGEADLARPSMSPEALAEVAELEALWRMSGPRRRASSE